MKIIQPSGYCQLDHLTTTVVVSLDNTRKNLSRYFQLWSLQSVYYNADQVILEMGPRQFFNLVFSISVSVGGVVWVEDTCPIWPIIIDCFVPFVIRFA